MRLARMPGFLEDSSWLNSCSLSCVPKSAQQRAKILAVLLQSTRASRLPHQSETRAMLCRAAGMCQQAPFICFM